MNISKRFLTTFYIRQSKNCGLLYKKTCASLNKKFLSINKISLAPNENATTLETLKNNSLKQKWFVNLSNIEIPDRVRDFVSLGHKFSFNTPSNSTDFISCIKNVESFLLKDLSSESSGETQVEPPTPDISGNFTNDNHKTKKQIFRNKFCEILSNSINFNRHIQYNDRVFGNDLLKTKKFLKNNPNVFFTLADKSSTTVCIDKNEYKNKVNDLLSDSNTYSAIKRSKTLLNKLQTKSYNLLKSWNENNYLFKKYHNIELSQTHTSLPKFYGLPKLHKVGCPVRPVLSYVNSPFSFLTKVLCRSIQSSVPLPKSTIKNSFEFINKIKNTFVPEDHVLVSFDVVSMFTNIKEHLVIDSIDRRYNTLNQNCKIPHSEIINAIKIIFDNNYFLFNDIVYKQKTGCPMGSSISSLFANLVMEDLEINCLSALDFKPVFYYRYVDDIITCIPKDKIQYMLGIFNNFSTDLQFTCEIENNGKISFLDTLLIRDGSNIIFDWYQKPTFSGRILNFDSNHPMHQKVAMVYNLVDRAILLSDKTFHSKNISFIKTILHLNNYPPIFSEKFIKKRITFLSLPKKPVKPTPKNINNTFIKIPSKINFFKKIKNLFRRYRIGILPILEKNLTSVIKRGKDITKKLDKKCVVYKIPCYSCNSCYVGQTKRALGVRLNEHKNDVIDCKQHSAVYNHFEKTGHMMDWDNASILDIETKWKTRLVSEMSHIHHQGSTLNSVNDTNLLAHQYKNLLRCLR